MQRLAADIEGGNPGRGADDDLVGEAADDGPEQRRLAGAGAAGDEEIAAAVQDEVEG